MMTILRYGVALGSIVLVMITLSPPAKASDIIIALNAELARMQNGQKVYINRSLARNLYLETVTIKSHGVDFLNGCKRSNINKHLQLPDTALPVVRYNAFTIVGSPYQSAPIKTGKNNNELYFKRITDALKIIEKQAPQTYAAISKTMQQNHGYIIIDNICPSDTGLAFAAFIPRPKQDHFIIMLSSTLLLLNELFNEYDIAAQMVHEMQGHAIEFYQTGATDEANAFRAQSAFAQQVGDANFLDVNNRTSNIQTKIKLKLSTSGTYVAPK